MPDRLFVVKTPYRSSMGEGRFWIEDGLYGPVSASGAEDFMSRLPSVSKREVGTVRQVLLLLGVISPESQGDLAYLSSAAARILSLPGVSLEAGSPCACASGDGATSSPEVPDAEYVEPDLDAFARVQQAMLDEQISSGEDPYAGDEVATAVPQTLSELLSVPLPEGFVMPEGGYYDILKLMDTGTGKTYWRERWGRTQLPKKDMVPHLYYAYTQGW